MLPFFTEKFGNASSGMHRFGWIAAEAVKIARLQIANFINAAEQEIIFTSGATEAINLAIKGVCESYVSKGNHIITVATEHKAVLDTFQMLEKKGMQVTVLQVNCDGEVNLDELKNSITPQTILVSCMYANNETGVIHPVQEIAKIIHGKNSIFMCDATQAVGKISVDVMKDGIDLMCMSAHKMYGPKGVGALYVRRKDPRVTLIAQMDGGGHERGLRSGTLNVPGIVGFGKACELVQKEMKDDLPRILKLRDKLEKELLQTEGVTINGSVKSRLPNTSNFLFKGIKADRFITKIPAVAVAMGSACTSAIVEPSHVLKAMGILDKDAYSSVRFSLGKYTTEKEIDTAVTLVKEAIEKLRS